MANKPAIRSLTAVSCTRTHNARLRDRVRGKTEAESSRMWNDDGRRATTSGNAGKVADALRDSSALSQAAGGAPQQALRAIDFSPIVSFGRFMGLGETPVGRCTPQNIPAEDPIVGGSFAKTSNILGRSER